MRFTLLACLICFSPTLCMAQAKFVSHPPMRPLPVPSSRPIAEGPALFVDAKKGDDRNPGERDRPWKTLAHAATRLKPGGTLYLRGGVYYEHVVIKLAASVKQPITIRSYPGELAIIDGGLREFFESPEKAWEPCPDGAPGEFRSVKAYPDLMGREDETNLLGNFGDSMVPLHGYKHLRDFRSDNVLWNFKDRLAETSAIWCGPGLYLNTKTKRIHVRLAHTGMKYLPDEDNYTGESDPRKVPLVIAGDRGQSPLTLMESSNVRLQDVVIRGARGPALVIVDCVNIEMDGVTAYAGSTAMLVRDTVGLRMWNCACRGIAAPWTFRGSLKYRAIEARLFSASGWTPTGKDSRDFEMAFSEFTDSVDGVFIGNVRGVKFHHNLVDNVSDDGLFLTAGTAYDGTTPGGDVHVYQNHLSRCLTTFAFGVGHGRQKALPGGASQTGSGVWIYRNVFDFRRPVMYHQPATQDGKVDSIGRFASDHGGPAWEPMFIYHNTILGDDPPRYSYGTYGLANAMGRGTKRRVFNNIVAHIHPLPGYVLPDPAVDLEADANLFWSVKGSESLKGDLFAKFRAKGFEESKKVYAPGWGASDRFADPRFVNLATDWRQPVHLALGKESPAIAAGVALPPEWPDPFRSVGGPPARKPDVGALPHGETPWHVGIRGRLSMFGEEKPAKSLPPMSSMNFPDRGISRPKSRPAAIVEGYPAFDAPLIEFTLRRQDIPVEKFVRTWLDTREYPKYRAVFLVGDLVRAKMVPHQYDADDLKRVAKYVEEGGTLVMFVRGRKVFQTPEGQKMLQSWLGPGSKEKPASLEVLEPKHEWVRHLKGETPACLMAMKAGEHVLPATKGERILGSAGGSVLHRQRVGKGQIIYVGWEIAASLPKTRAKAATLEEERGFEEQMGVLLKMTAPASRPGD